MDNNQFSSAYMPYPHNPTSQSPAPYPGLASAQSQQSSHQSGQSQQQSTSQPSQSSSASQHDSHPTLPPLQSQNGGYAHYGSMGTPHTPVTSSISNGHGSAYPHLSPASAMGPPNSFGSGTPAYALSQSMMYPSPTTTSSGNGLPTIRPMPPVSGSMSASLASLPSLATSQLGQHSSFMQNEEAPTHVVGSQGRRGILPSAPGRPNATAPGVAASTKSMSLQKDADGKFPCPHCNKTYLHAKHLKRHMLRHTGDRPYSCHLCKDTFSRSDILKRHFQKCSLRRGNPTGASHLAHQRRPNTNGSRYSISQQDGPIGLASLPEVSGSGPYNPATGIVDHSPTVSNDASTRTSRANSLISPANASHRNSLAGLGINSASSADSMNSNSPGFQSLHGYGLPNVSGSSHLPSAYAFNQPHQLNGNFYPSPSSQQHMPFLGHPNSRFDHSHSNSPHQQSPNTDNHHFNQNGQDGFMAGELPGQAAGQNSEHIKNEHDSKHFTHDIGNDLTNGGNMGVVWS